MVDTENVFDGFALLDDDEDFDVDKIFGSSSDTPTPPPPAPPPVDTAQPQSEPEPVQTETAESQPEPEQTLPAKTQESPAEEAEQPLDIFSAFTSAESDLSQRQTRPIALRQGPKHNCRSLISRPFFSTAEPESRSQIPT